MKQVAVSNLSKITISIREQYIAYTLVFIAGLLGPLGFAPFHMPGFIIISLALFYSLLLNHTIQQSFLLGFDMVWLILAFWGILDYSQYS